MEMERKKRVTKIRNSLNNLGKQDTYSFLMFTLYKLKDDPKWTGLSELCYLLDGDSFSKLLTYYGGMTITIPTLKEFRLLLKGLTVYDLVNLQGFDYDCSLKTVKDSEFKEAEIAEVYKKILEVTADYEFGGINDAEK